MCPVVGVTLLLLVVFGKNGKVGCTADAVGVVFGERKLEAHIKSYLRIVVLERWIALEFDREARQFALCIGIAQLQGLKAELWNILIVVENIESLKADRRNGKA